jgi:hypothetical protein
MSCSESFYLTFLCDIFGCHYESRPMNFVKEWQSSFYDPSVRWNPRNCSSTLCFWFLNRWCFTDFPSLMFMTTFMDVIFSPICLFIRIGSTSRKLELKNKPCFYASIGLPQ